MVAVGGEAMAREPVVMVLGTGRLRWVYEAVMVILALVVVATLPLEDRGWVRTVNVTVWGVFVVDYFTRLALSTDRRSFFRRNIIDLVAILPADFFRAARVLRLARLFRVLRAAVVIARVSRDVRGVAGTNGLGWVLLVSSVTILGAAVGVSFLEPALGAFGDALWWSIVTATTVGYGDLSPEHPLARALAVVLMLVGIGTIGMLTGSIATYFISDRPDPDEPADVAYVRQRLHDWTGLTHAERERVAAMLSACCQDEALQSGPG